MEADPLNWRLLWCSSSMLRLFGYTAVEWEDLCPTMEDLHPIESLPLVRSEYTRIASADHAPALDLPCRRRDGSIFYCKLSPGLARIGNDSTLIVFFTDVTPEYQARRAVEQTRAALLKAQEIAKLGSWELDIAAGELSWSPEVFRIFEQAAENFIPDYRALLAAIHPDDRPMVERAYWDALAKRTPYDLTHRLLLPNGRIKWVHDRCESEFAPDGRPLKSHGTIQDITEQEIAALALADQQRRLSNIIDGTRVGTWSWDIADRRHGVQHALGRDRRLPTGRTPPPSASRPGTTSLPGTIPQPSGSTARPALQGRAGQLRMRGAGAPQGRPLGMGP